MNYMKKKYITYLPPKAEVFSFSRAIEPICTSFNSDFESLENNPYEW